jgi:hypothetical protein
VSKINENRVIIAEFVVIAHKKVQSLRGFEAAASGSADKIPENAGPAATRQRSAANK